MLSAPIRLSYPYKIKLQWIQLDWLCCNLETYLRYAGTPDNEWELYRLHLIEQLYKRLERKCQAMEEAIQRHCRLTFVAAEIVLVRSLLMNFPYETRTQQLLALFDQARVNLLPLHPT